MPSNTSTLPLLPPSELDGLEAAWCIAEYVREGAHRWPESIYFRDGTQELTYAETWRRICSIAAWLRRQGIGHNDRVVMVTDNRIETVLLFFAVAQIGAISVILHPQIKPEGLRRILSQTEPKLGLLDSATAWLREEFRETPLVWVGCENEDCHFPDLIAEEEPPVVPYPGLEIDPALLVFTSGSTGTPRGVILTHDNVRFVSAAIQARLPYRAEDRVAIFLPLSFDYGLYQVFYAAIRGASIFIGRPEHAGPELLRILAAQEISVLPGVPTLFGGLIKMQRYRPVPLPKMRIITSTGDHLPQSYIASIRELFPQALVYPMYGLTECKRVSILLPDELDAKPESVGRPLDGTEVFAVDEDGKRLPPGEIGELCIRGPHLALGYWRAPEETAKRYPVLDGTRVLRSGDFGSLDVDGFLYIHGRSDFLIKHKGHRLSPAEVEEEACLIPGIVAAGCIKDEAKDLLCLFVSVSESSLGEAQIIQALSVKLEPAKVPNRVFLLPELPKTGNQKIDRKALRAIL
ncbi:class I adenylate-forming enzyme family protein [Prosthecobacter sp.]|jgi:acyl-CoA synthetase (AMP-forming)/AMP-acid ligase II|uniref:class I adenylate-forming enzyme family protein n=1 Tax=Prosthecobacter sp. TaxID=1965333 RepID=UPI0037C62763